MTEPRVRHAEVARRQAVGKSFDEEVAEAMQRVDECIETAALEEKTSCNFDFNLRYRSNEHRESLPRIMSTVSDELRAAGYTVYQAYESDQLHPLPFTITISWEDA